MSQGLLQRPSCKNTAGNSALTYGMQVMASPAAASCLDQILSVQPSHTLGSLLAGFKRFRW